MELLSYMRLFVEVAKRRSFRHAAEAMDMPNSTLSRQISELEKMLGLRLLHRSTRRVELTEAGELYFKRCQSLVEEALAVHETLRDAALRPTGTLRISMPVDLAIGYLAPIINDFAQHYPQIDFELDLTPRHIDLQTEPFDLAIRLGPPPAGPSTLIARQIGTVSRWLYAAPQYLKRAPPLKHPKDLAHHIMCVGKASSRWQEKTLQLRKNDEQVEIEVTTRFLTNNVGLSRTLAVLGNGVAVLGPELARDDVQSGRLKHVLPGWGMEPLPIQVLTGTRLLPARARLFIDYLKDRLSAPT